eukprot:89427-Prymnesium_polylepis.1
MRLNRDYSDGDLRNRRRASRLRGGHATRLKESRRRPPTWSHMKWLRLVGVQASTCPPLAGAWARRVGSPVVCDPTRKSPRRSDA